MKNSAVTFIVKVENQEKNIEIFGKNIIFTLKKFINEDIIRTNSLIYFIDNSSTDNSWYEISKQKVRYPVYFKGIKLDKKASSKAIKNHIKKQKNLSSLIIEIGFDYNENKILEIIKTNQTGIFNLKKKIGMLAKLKDLFLSNKVIIKEEF